MGKKAPQREAFCGQPADLNRAVDAELHRLDPQLAHFLRSRFGIGARSGWSVAAMELAGDTARIELAALRALRASALATR
jgi:hypothetical protein